MKKLLPILNRLVITFITLTLFYSQDSYSQTIISGDSSFCEGDTGYFTASLNPDEYADWSAFGGTDIDPGNDTLKVIWGAPGVGLVTVLIKDSLGNTIGSSSLDITIHDAPNPFITTAFEPDCGRKEQGKDRPEDCLKACDSSVHYYSTALHPGHNYSWNVVGAISYTENNNELEVYWSAPGTGYVEVTETNEDSCATTHQICIDIIESPEAAFNTTPVAIGGVVTICKGGTVFFNNLSDAGTGSPIVQNLWNFGDGNTLITNANSVQNTYNTPGFYDVVLTVTNKCGCIDSATITVEVLTSPGPDIFCISTECENNTSTYSTNADCANYEWFVENGTIIESPPYSATITVQWGTNGPGVLGLYVGACDTFCADTTYIQIPIITSTTNISGDTTPCLYSFENYQIPIMPGSIYTWTVSAPNTIIAGQGTNEVNVYWTQAGIQTLHVTYYNPLLGCEGEATLQVNVSNPFNIAGPTTVCQNATETYNFTPFIAGALFDWVLTNNSGTTVASNTGVQTDNISFSFPPGNYQLSVTETSSLFCNDVETLNILVKEKPPVPPTPMGPIEICPNSTYSYTTSPTSPGNFITWQITNGTPATASGNTINVTWGPTGPYIVQAIQESSSSPSCPSDPSALTVTTLLPLTGQDITGPMPACENSIQSYEYEVDQPIDYVEWEISPSGAGSVTSGQGGQLVEIEWNDYTGPATLTLTVSVCNQTFTYTESLIVQPAPTPTITAPTEACAEELVIFSSTFPGSGFTWDFGDGSTGSGNPATHAYNSPGTYVVTVSATPTGCALQTTATHIIQIKALPDAVIATNDPLEYCPTQIINTTFNAVINTGTFGYQWYFNGSPIGGATSTTYTGTNTGNYSVLVLDSTTMCSKMSNVLTISQGPCNPPCKPVQGSSIVPFFSFDNDTCNLVNFTANLTPSGGSIVWNFDDPTSGSNTAMGSSATHLFENPGLYLVTAYGTVPEAGGGPGDSCVIFRQLKILIPIIPDFNVEFACDGGGNMTTQFIDLSTYYTGFSIDDYNWDIVGNTTYNSTLDEPLLNLAPGGYEVSLTIENTATGFSCILTDSIYVPQPATANFGLSDTSVCEGVPIQFTDSSLGVIISYSWDFDNGSSSSITNPTFTYTNSNNYQPQLIVIDDFGCTDTSSRSIEILENNLNVNIGYDSLVACQGVSLNLEAQISGGYPAYDLLWNTTETTTNISASLTGNYFFEVTDEKGCFARSSNQEVIIHPKPTARILGKSSLCYGADAPVIYNGNTGAYNYNWSYGIYTATSSEYYLYNTYSVGTQNLILEVTDPVTACNASDTLEVTIHALPAAPVISSTSPSLCAGSPVTLDATHPTLTDFYWNNGEVGNTITTSSPGIYEVTVIDSNQCSNTANDTVFFLPDLANLMTGCYDLCDTFVTEKPILVGPIPPIYFPYPVNYEYQWFYNGNPIAPAPGTMQNLPLVPGQNGTYTLALTANPDSCTILSDPIEINWEDCDTCELEATIKCVTCGPVNSDGIQTYEFVLIVNNDPGSTGGTLTLATGSGTLSPSTFTLTPGTNVLSGIFTDIPPANSTLCIAGDYIDNNGEHCEFKVCHAIPPCPLKECDIKVKEAKSDCYGESTSGLFDYFINSQMEFFGNSGSEITIVPNYGTITGLNTNILNSGSNNINFMVQGVPTHIKELCFDVYIYDPISATNCYTRFCVKLQPCDGSNDCEIDFKAIKIECKTSSPVPTYAVSMDINNATGNSYSANILSNNGTIAGSPVTISPGGNSISFVFEDNGSIDQSTCFTLVLSNAVGQKCILDTCIKLPKCSNQSTVYPSLELNKSFKVYPNPTQDKFKVSYVLDQASYQIELTDLTGKLIYTETVNNTTGQVEVDMSKQAAGVYLVRLVGPDGNALPTQKMMLMK